MHQTVRLLACCFAACLLLVGCERSLSPAALAKAEQQFIDQLYVGYIVPHTERFTRQAQVLRDAAAGFCAARDTPHFEVLQEAWRRTALAWQPLRWLQTGPGADQHRMLRLDVWPQAPLELVATRVRQLLVSGQPVGIQAVAGHPVQVQGLPALEILLFEPDAADAFPADAAGDRRCALVAGIAGNIAGIAQAEAVLWQRGAVGGNPANALFVSAGSATIPPHQVLNLLGNLLMQQLVELKDDALGAPVGVSATAQPIPPRPRLAHSWPSRLSLARVVVSLEAIEELFAGAGEAPAGGSAGLAALLAVRGAAEEAAQFQELLATALAQARRLRDDGVTLYDGVSDEGTHAALVELRNSVHALEVYTEHRVTPALGITLTFNFADGD